MRVPPSWTALATVAATAALATLGSPQAQATSTATPAPVPADVRSAMMRDLHLSESGLQRRIAQEADATRTATVLRAELGDRIAGVWFDEHDGRLHTAVSSEADASAARAAGAVAHRVPHSKADLDKALASISAKAAKVPGVVSWGPDVRSDRIDVTVDPTRSTDATSTFLKSLAPLGDMVHVTQSADVPRQQGGTVVGGEKWLVGTQYICSIGFPVTRADGAKAFLTAGHCTTTPDENAYGKDGTLLGTSNKGGTGSVNSREGDMGIVDVTQSGWDLAGKVSGWGNGDINVTGSADAVVGTAICHSGQTTGYHCGKVTKVNQSVDYGKVVVDGLSYSDACSAGGDSGGSYVTATGGKAVGLHSGGGTTTCTSGSGTPFTIFQPVNEALAKFGVSLVTAPSQTGSSPVLKSPGNQNLYVGRPVGIALTTTGGTTPYTYSATGLPAGLTINTATGTITGTPTTWGMRNTTLTVTDAAGRTSSVTVTFTVWY